LSARDSRGLTPSCPRCGVSSSPGAGRCAGCGFAFFEEAEARRLPRPSGRVLGAGAAVAAAAVAIVLLATRDSPPDPPGPVAAREAERRLELRFSRSADDETAAVRCPQPIPPGRIVRCEIRYADGIARALMVRVMRDGELDASVPYPATLRR